MRKTKGRPKSFNESEVLALAMNYFWEHGYDNASLDNLLEVMGIKKSSFYHTFKSKEELFSRCLELYRKTNAEELLALKNEIGPKKTMLELTNMKLKELKETGKVKGCLIVNSGKESYLKYKDLNEQIGREFLFLQDMFANIVKEAQEKGEIKSKKDSKILASRYMNSLNGLILTIQAGARQEMIDDLVESLKEIIE